MKTPPLSGDRGRQSEAASPSPHPEHGASLWSPLQRAVFRSVWIALVASNIGTWMQSVGAAWLMTTLTPSPLLVALMQRSEEHTSELQSRLHLVCRLLLEKKKHTETSPSLRS